MPTYEYECESCGQKQDGFAKIADRFNPRPCPCGGEARFVISCPMIECDEIYGGRNAWVREFAKAHNRQDGKRNRAGGPPIESRTDYKRYLKDRDLRPTRGENLSEV